MEEEEATEGAVGGCRVQQDQPVVVWQQNQAAEDRVVDLAAAMEDALDESTIDTVRAMGKVYVEL